MFYAKIHLPFYENVVGALWELLSIELLVSPLLSIIDMPVSSLVSLTRQTCIYCLFYDHKSVTLISYYPKYSSLCLFLSIYIYIYIYMPESSSLSFFLTVHSSFSLSLLLISVFKFLISLF